MPKKPAKAKKKAPAERLPVLSIAGASRIVGVSTQWLRNLIDSGHVKRTGKGVTERDCWRGLLAWTKDEQRRSTKTAATSRVQDARAKEIETRLAERAGRLMDVEAITIAIDEWGGAVRSGLSALPAQISDDIDERQRIERLIDGILQDAIARF